MKRVILSAAIAAACAGATGTALADGYDDTGAFYFNPMLQYSLLDDRRVSKDNFGYQAGVGYNLPRNFAVEANVSEGTYYISGSGASERVSAITLDGMYKFLPPGSLFRPYTLFGAGKVSDKVGGSTYHDEGWLAEAGVGVLTGIGSQSGSFRVQFRTEAKYRREFVQSALYVPTNPGDVIFGIGLNLSFGNPTPPPPMIAKAAPVIEEAPPPPPPPPPAPPADSDMDGVPDTIDRCPNTPRGDKVDAYGCTIKDEIRLPGVTFAINSDELTPESDTVLGYAVDTLKQHPEFVIEVDGHTDNTGSDKLNNALSQRRAESVMRYLKAHGVTNSLTAKGYGKSHPIEDNRTAEGRLANRRVALKVTSGL